jgi:DNA gyrase subunit A
MADETQEPQSDETPIEPQPRIIPINIEEEMKAAYIDYSMSVIVSRALPDARDGMKPVHRRIMYAMSDMGMAHNRAYRKSATVVGEVLGKYHPHGDSAVYQTMVRMAQDFSMRYMLVDGQGNFGSIDGDSAAAMRYTEARMTRFAEEMLSDINKETVDFIPNYDGSREEPEVLPAALPNLLLNGSSGIAVGMATNIPPHNLGELIDGVIAYIDNHEITIPELMKLIPAPDFPTAGIIYGTAGVKEAYHTGRGRVIMRAKMHEEIVHNRNSIIITEIPFQVIKSAVIEKIAQLVRDKKIEGIHDLRDESDREGMRIVIELKKDAVPLVIQNQLYKFTALQSTFGVNMVALVKGRPRTITLKEALQYYVEHRHEVVVRRTEFELRKAEARAHILEGLRIALDHIDAVINIIRYSPTVDEAQQHLMVGLFPDRFTMEMRTQLGLPTHGESMFSLSELQSKAILELRLQRLTGLERQKIEDEYRELIQEIERLRTILGNEALRMQIIKDELLVLREKYADRRRTEIDFTGGEDFILEDLIEEEQMVVTMTHLGLIKRTATSEYKAQGRGGKGLRGAGTRDEDYIEQLFVCGTHDWLLFFTDFGKCYLMRVYEIPEGARTGKGRSIRNLIQIDQEDRVRAILAVPKKDFADADFLANHYIFKATRNGTVKKTPLEDYRRRRADGIRAISIDEDDQLLDVKLTDGNAEIILASSAGYAVRFNESKVRSMGRTAHGVKGMTLGAGEILVGMIAVTDPEMGILTVSEKGLGKRSKVEDYRLTNRGGKGVITMKTTEKTGKLVTVRGVTAEDDLMIATTNGLLIRIALSNVREMGRAAQGVKLLRLNDGDAIADVSRVVKEDDEENTDAVVPEEIALDEVLDLNDVTDDEADLDEGDADEGDADEGDADEVDADEDDA